MQGDTFAHPNAPPRHIVEASKLLVACDFDGTLAAIVAKPSLAVLDPIAGSAINELLRLDRTDVAVISGRGLADVRRLLKPAPGVHIIGSHGAEIDGDAGSDATPKEISLRDRILDAVRGTLTNGPGLFAEAKPLGAALHTRGTTPDVARRATDAVRSALAGLPAITERAGHAVVEWSVRSANKGDALTTLATRLGASASIFIGDDETDEDAFRALGEGDLAIRVGPGPTAASLRLESQAAVGAWLTRLAEERRRHAR